VRSPIVMGGVVLVSWIWALTAVTVAAEVNPTTAEAQLRAAMTELGKANVDGDTDKADRLLAAGYVQTDISGHVQGKSEWLAEYFRPLAQLIKAGQFHWDLREEKDVQVRFFRDTAVVVGSLTMKGTEAALLPERGWDASPGTSVGLVTFRFTRVFIKRDGRWLLAALHNAVVPDLGRE
jgi:hypothetical protein